MQKEIHISAKDKEIVSGAVMGGMMGPLFLTGLTGLFVGAIIGALLASKGK